MSILPLSLWPKKDSHFQISVRIMDRSMNKNASAQKSQGYYPIIMIGVLFFIFGFVTWLNGTLIPFLKISCELNNVEAYLVTFAFYISYLVMAPPSSFVLAKVGFKNGMGLGLLVMAAGSLLFIPAAYSRAFPLFLTGLFIQGSGLALLQTASNPYVTLVGPIESAAKRISIMGICNKLAGAVSPLILGAVVLQGASQIMKDLEVISGPERISMLDNLAQRAVVPYVIMAVVLVGLAIMIKYSRLPEVEEQEETTTDDHKATSKKTVFSFPHLLLGFVAIFVYVGVEVMAGDTIVLYGQSQGIPLEISRNFTTFTLGFMILGYILGILTIPKIISQGKALAVSASLGVLFTAGAIFTNGYTSVLFIALLGLANALMWPAIWPLAIADLGKQTKAGSALLIMGIAGGATIPLLYGYLSDHGFTTQTAYWIMIPFYAFILYFAVSGHKIRLKKS
jgi:glucose/galactose transporter